MNVPNEEGPGRAGSTPPLSTAGDCIRFIAHENLIIGLTPVRRAIEQVQADRPVCDNDLANFP
jgi:hypothetical protein